MPITFRPITPDDADFLLRVYGSTRSDEMALVPWNEAQREAFVRMQFEAQHQYYQSKYPAGDFLLILFDDRPVGRLYVARLEEEIRIVDVTVLPAERGAGIGTALLKDLMAEAARTKRPLRIYVENYNPSVRLFERLGFSATEDDGVNLLMQWRADA